jgi:hypothetical protein
MVILIYGRTFCRATEFIVNERVIWNGPAMLDA